MLIFCETKRNCDNITRTLRQDGWPALALHGDKAQKERDWVLAEFKSGKHPLMLATDVAARGLGAASMVHACGALMHVTAAMFVLDRHAVITSHGSFLGARRVVLCCLFIEAVSTAAAASAGQHQQVSGSLQAAVACMHARYLITLMLLLRGLALWLCLSGLLIVWGDNRVSCIQPANAMGNRDVGSSVSGPQ